MRIDETGHDGGYGQRRLGRHRPLSANNDVCRRGVHLRRFSRGGISPDRHQYLIDALPVHVQNPEGAPLPLESVSFRREAPEGVHDHPANRLVGRPDLAG